MKLTCDLCGGELEINAAGAGVVCKNCGLTYSVERLKEKLAAQPAGKPAEEDVIYNVVDYVVVDNSGGGNSQKPPVVKTPPVTKSAANTSARKPSPAEAKKPPKRMWIMWCLLGLFFFSAFMCALTIEEAGALLCAFVGHAVWIIIILLIFKPWKVYGGKAI